MNKDSKDHLMKFIPIYGFLLSFAVFGVLIKNILASAMAGWLVVLYMFCFIAGLLTKALSELTGECLLNTAIVFFIIFCGGVYYELVTFIYLSIIVVAYSLGLYLRWWIMGSYVLISSDMAVDYFKELLLGSYLILYVTNIIFEGGSSFLSMIWCMSLLGIGLYKCNQTNPVQLHEIHINKLTIKDIHKKVFYIRAVMIFLVFITAGISYTIIFKHYEAFQGLNRYYNTLPFIVTLLTINRIFKVKNHDQLCSYGVGFLGIAFVFGFSRLNVWTFLLSQTALQIGWALMDLYVWVIGLSLGRKNNQVRVFIVMIALFITGTLTGSVLGLLVSSHLTDTSLGMINIITYMPLFIGVIFIGQLKPLYTQEERERQAKHNRLNQLTEREKEVMTYFLENKKNIEVCQLMFISENTLKTHSRHLYHKLEVKNKSQLIATYKALIDENHP